MNGPTGLTFALRAKYGKSHCIRCQKELRVKEYSLKGNYCLVCTECREILDDGNFDKNIKLYEKLNQI